MWIFCFLGFAYFLFCAITKKGKGYKSKMGTPLPEREAKVARIFYFITSGLLLVVGVIALIQYLS